MHANELPETSQPPARGEVCVVLAAQDGDGALATSLESIRANSTSATAVVAVAATAADVNSALRRLAPADVVVLEEPCLVPAGWLERLREAAAQDTNTATVSSLADSGTALSLADEPCHGSDLAEVARRLAADTLRLRPRLSRAVGPCVYVRRESLELVGLLDEELELPAALELDFAQRCLLSGLSHVLADDVVVGRAAPMSERPQPTPEGRLLERYPYLPETPLAQSGVLEHALRAARGQPEQVLLTLDARALDGAVTGTQVHILELIRALAHSGSVRMRVLVWGERIDAGTLTLLGGLPETEVLMAEDVGADTPRSTIFHRPQQAFSPGDVTLALALGERVVLSQLDLIAYSNPGYFADAASWEAYRRSSRHGLSAAERVVVFSEHTRQELLSDALLPAERIRVVPPGLDHRAAHSQRRPPALEDGPSDAIAAGFLLCLGTDFRHKNRVFALRLLSSLRDEHGWEGILVLAGTHIPHGSSREIEADYLHEHPELREFVVDLGSVSEAEKAWLLAHTQAVVYPSVYEGFGLVPFESALGGAPCVFAPRSSLAEVAPVGTATILPWDPVQSAAALGALLSDPDVRARHIQTLAEAARPLTWAAAAASMVAVYREAAAAPVREAAVLSRDLAERERALISSHRRDVERLIDERELVLGDHRKLLAEVGPGRSLVGPGGSLPEDLQRMLLALSARPALARPLFGALARVFAFGRAAGRLLRGRRGAAR